MRASDLVFPKIRVCFSKLRVSENAEIGVSEIYANCQNRSSTMIVTQSRNVFIYSFARVEVMVSSVLLETVCSKARIPRELASHFYSDVTGSNPISLYKKKNIENNFAKTNK